MIFVCGPRAPLPADREALLALDRSFTTERVYRVTRTADSFALEEIAR